jgi:hypothetical protein
MNYYKEFSERASIFRLDGDTYERLPPLSYKYEDQFKNSSGVYQNGTITYREIQNQFFGNTYQSCNQVAKGAVFYLENGARAYDFGSKFYKLSALEGGVAFI